MKTSIVCTLLSISFIVILTPTLYPQEADSSGSREGSDWMTRDRAKMAALGAKDTSPTFSLTLSPGKPKEIISEYRVGDDMWMTIIMTNLTNHDIDASMDGGGGYDRLFGYEAFDEDGKRVEERHHGTEGYSHTAGIGAGGKASRMILLNQVFKLDRPGKYTIRVSRPEPFVEDEKGESPVIWSNSITIQITG
jgi:hypothetical protein